LVKKTEDRIRQLERDQARIVTFLFGAGALLRTLGEPGMEDEEPSGDHGANQDVGRPRHRR